jgi:hypothetical protein
MIAAEEFALALHTVANYGATAMSTSRCQGLNCTFEAIEGVGLAIHHNLEGFFVFITARFALCHGMLLFFDRAWLITGDALTGAAGAVGATTATVTSPVDDHADPQPFCLDGAACRANCLNCPAVSFAGLFHRRDS